MYSRVGPCLGPFRTTSEVPAPYLSVFDMQRERAFCQELDYSFLYRWFLDMDLMEPSFDPTVSTKNRRRLLRHKVGRTLFEEVAYEADGVNAVLKMGENVSMCSDNVRLSVQRFCPFVSPPLLMSASRLDVSSPACHLSFSRSIRPHGPI